MLVVSRALIRGAAAGVALLATLLLASCGTQENYRLGVAFLEESGRGVELVELEPSRTDEFQLSAPPGFAGQIGTLLVGSRPGFLVRGAVRFDADSVAAAGPVVDSAFVEIVLNEGLGDRQSLEMELYKITSDWDDSDSSLTFPGTDPAARLTVDVPFAADTVDTLRMDLAALVQEWVSDSTSNFGFALIPTAGQDSEIEFSSRESATPPRLLIYSTSGADVVLTTLNPVADSFLLETTPGHVPPIGLADRLTLARGLPARALLDFDIPEFGDRVTIHRAEVVVHVDPAASVTNGFAAGLQRITSETWAGENTEADLLLHGATNLSADGDSVVFAITAIVQQILSDGNYGMQLRALEERQDTDHVRIFGPGTGMPPVLRIWFTPGAGDES